MKITNKELTELAISNSEYRLILKRLGREPNHLELGLFGSLWSEHCGYKHSKLLIKTLPNESDRLLVEPGVENAGVIDLDEFLGGLAKVTPQLEKFLNKDYGGNKCCFLMTVTFCSHKFFTNVLYQPMIPMINS